MSITAEQFYSAMGKIRGDLPRKVRRFMATVAALGVKGDFQGALNLRWERPAGPPINLGVIQRNGQIWTETVNAHAPPDIAHRYIQELASAFSMQVEKEAFKGAWQVRDNNHAPPAFRAKPFENILIDEEERLDRSHVLRSSSVARRQYHTSPIL
jgi:hypothetical protein